MYLEIIGDILKFIGISYVIPFLISRAIYNGLKLGDKKGIIKPCQNEDQI